MEPALWTALTIGGAYLLGHLINLIVSGRLTRWAGATQGQWDDVLVRTLTSRIPLWSVLAGAWLSLGYWPITERWLHLASRHDLRARRPVGDHGRGRRGREPRGRPTGRARCPAARCRALTQNVVRLLVITFGLLVVLNGLGVEIRPMLAALGVGGLAVALALQEPLSNLFAGLFITMAGQIRIGDFVQAGPGPRGPGGGFQLALDVARGGAPASRVVPNVKLAQAIVTNHNLPTPEVNVPVDFVVDYASDAAGRGGAGRFPWRARCRRRSKAP